MRKYGILYFSDQKRELNFCNGYLSLLYFWLRDISSLDFSTPSFNPRLFNHEFFNPRLFNYESLNPGYFNHELFNRKLLNPKVKKKLPTQDFSTTKLFNQELFNHDFLRKRVEKFRVEKSVVEKPGVEMSFKLIVRGHFNHEPLNPGFFNPALGVEKPKEVCNRGVACSLLKLDGG